MNTNGQPVNYSVSNAHSHNDYLNKDPFNEAFAAGFGSIEADIFVRQNELLVAHSKKSIDASKTLDNLYLDPLLAALKKDKTRKLILLIDLKDNYSDVLPVLVEHLKPLKKYCSTPEKPKNLKIVISGSRPLPSEYKNYPDFLFFDDDLVNPHTAAELERVGMVSLNFANYYKWDGIQTLPENVMSKIEDVITQVHKTGKIIRFWAAPDTELSWQTQIDLGADFIGTDKIQELADFIGRNEHALKVMSYNMHHCNPPSKPDFIDIDAIAKLINQHKPDLVALQEIDVNTKRSGVNEAEELAKKTGLNFYFAKAIDFQGGDYGVAILSKYKLENTKIYPLPNTPGSKAEPRVLATAEIALPDGKKIVFACTHLDATKETSERELQINEITRIAGTIKLPVIIAGDFNATPESSIIKKLDQTFKRTCDICGPTIPSVNPKKTIDFIAFKPLNIFSALSHEVIQEPYASDHLPVIATISISQK